MHVTQGHPEFAKPSIPAERSMSTNGRWARFVTLSGLAGLALVLIGCSGEGAGPRSTNTCAGSVCIETVNVTDAGNPADPDTGHGSVAENFAIGTYEVNVTQYLTFLNSAATVPAVPAIAELWSDEMQNTYGYVSPGLIARTGSGTGADPFAYAEIFDPSLGEDSGRRAILNISWFDAARFANWLHTGATSTANTETGAYTLDGATSGVFIRNADARWWIPSGDEWYKAAYYDPTKPGSGNYWTYPTGTDELPVAETFPGGSNSGNYDGAMSEGRKITPTGAYVKSVSHYGTFDQAGLLWEWNDEVHEDFDGNPITRGLRGGSWSLGIINVSKFGPRDYEPTYDDDDTGFRLATGSN
jgi:formylglycine-generating enzyme required for sulfatase activity